MRKISKDFLEDIKATSENPVKEAREVLQSIQDGILEVGKNYNIPYFLEEFKHIKSLRKLAVLYCNYIEEEFRVQKIKEEKVRKKNEAFEKQLVLVKGLKFTRK